MIENTTSYLGFISDSWEELEEDAKLAGRGIVDVSLSNSLRIIYRNLNHVSFQGDAATPVCQQCRKLGITCKRNNPIRFVSAKTIHVGPEASGYISRVNLSSDRSLNAGNLDTSGSSESLVNIRSSTPARAPDESSRLAMFITHELDPECNALNIAASQSNNRTSNLWPSSGQQRMPHVLSTLIPYSSSLFLSPPRPLQDEKELHIFRHYIDVLSTWLDFCDVQRTFGVIVPQLATLHSPLLNAILAVSSKHLGILTGQNMLSAGMYHQKCLSGLIPLLSDNSAVMNDMILAVAVILRLGEELEAPMVQVASPGHMQGIRQCVRAQGRIAPQSRLRFAALCVMVRQENYLALVNMSPIGWDLNAFTIPRNPCVLDEQSWTMLVVRLCADLVQFASNEQSKQDRERWNQLKDLNEEWILKKPRSFDPLLSKEANRAEGDPFPKSWFCQVWHSTSIQHYHLNRVLLAVSSPHVPRLGPGHKEAYSKAEDEILTQMRYICGIALVNTTVQPCMVTAYMSISICGDRFIDQLERERIFELLMLVNKGCGWPTTNLQQQLKRAWGWE